MGIEFLGLITVTEVEYLAAVAGRDVRFPVETAGYRRQDQATDENLQTGVGEKI